MGETAPVIMSAYVHMKFFLRCLYQCWFLKKDFSGGKQLPVLPSWLHPVCDVAKAKST